jgi:hypothetical protein
MKVEELIEQYDIPSDVIILQIFDCISKFEDGDLVSRTIKGICEVDGVDEKFAIADCIQYTIFSTIDRTCTIN